MAAHHGIDKLKGTWEYVDGEHFDDYMKELVRRYLCFVYLTGCFLKGCWLCSSSIS
jgi:hypothetical protein